MSTNRKHAILQSLFPLAVLKAETTQSLHALPGAMQRTGLIPVYGFPFSIGRESRVMLIKGVAHRLERPGSGIAEGLNDIYLMDTGALLQISREHCRIEQAADGGFQIVDRHSKCGVSVNGVRIGDHAGVLSAPLHDGALVIIGTHDSPYRFSFITGFDNAEMLRSPAALSQATDRT